MYNWQGFSTEVGDLIKSSSAIFSRIRAAVAKLPKPESEAKIYFNPKTQVVHLSLPDGTSEDFVADWKDGVKVRGIKHVHHVPNKEPEKETGPWIRVKMSVAVKDVLGPVAQAAGWKSNPLFQATPLSATLASGALGAGAGYLGGTLLEHLFPERYLERGRLRKTLGLMGGIGGAIPGAWAGTVNMRNGTGWTDPIGAVKESAIRQVSDILDIFMLPSDAERREAYKLAEAWDDEAAADIGPGLNAGLANMNGNVMVKNIDRDRLNRPIWTDPYTPPELKATTSGILEGASQVEGGDSNLISPLAVGRMAVGMGTGMASGLIVGKVLGALSGISPQAQEGLQRAGIWAGLIKSVVPMMLPRS